MRTDPNYEGDAVDRPHYELWSVNLELGERWRMYDTWVRADAEDLMEGLAEGRWPDLFGPTTAGEIALAVNAQAEGER